MIGEQDWSDEKRRQRKEKFGPMNDIDNRIQRRQMRFGDDYRGMISDLQNKLEKMVFERDSLRKEIVDDTTVGIGASAYGTTQRPVRRGWFRWWGLRKRSRETSTIDQVIENE
eukprot:UN09909